MFFEKGLNYAEISRMCGFDFKTVKKYIFQKDFNEPMKQKQTCSSKLDPFKEENDTWLEADKSCRKKQLYTARRVFHRLSERYKTFDCSYRLLAEYVSQEKKKPYSEEKQLYFQIQHIPGAAQVGFGEVDFLSHNGMRETGHHLNISFPN